MGNRRKDYFQPQNFNYLEGLKMRKFLFLLVLSAVARKVLAAVQNNQPAAEAKANEALTPSA
jgi:hypothetical protein